MTFAASSVYSLETYLLLLGELVPDIDHMAPCEVHSLGPQEACSDQRAWPGVSTACMHAPWEGHAKALR